jgi:tRNA U34 5-methylaminomethyl-2-thiouridine-forming methyltransferase MnmC
MEIASEQYRLMRLANGAYSLRSETHGETFHPVIGPMAEAEALYVNQARLPMRMAQCTREFVIWDIGLGAAANPLAVLQATRHVPCQVRLVSFDRTLRPLAFALENAGALGYFNDFQEPLKELMRTGQTIKNEECRIIRWELRVADFPTWTEQAAKLRLGAASAAQMPMTSFPPAPDAILFDAYSPAKNPAMWTLPLFTRLFSLLDPRRPCSLATYSRSTLLRATLLLAGFYVGRGRATGEKEETTVAANTPDLIDAPLDARWLTRARHSTSAEPLREDVYRQAPLTPESWEQLRQHPQF